ncbi:COBRA-like protein 10 [Punica granatum]|uniref:COBRA-like protein 10 n=1 Tax=Punica granatum TaxID=22663 RepID=A0A218X964_PUNGR|nr:COBRA-like protein 10 [Punica granatum]OWM81250.1 hypothetical protein CDL15_Pgr007288 [Punica granatum]
MRTPPMRVFLAWVTLLLLSSVVSAQDYDDPEEKKNKPPPEQESCTGVFLSYNFIEREKEYPHVKNATAQAWAFKSQLTVLNAGLDELKAWRVFIKFQHEEVLVSVTGAVIIDGDDLPAKVSKNGTLFAGYPMADLKTSVETAGDINQIQAKIDILGTVFGIKPPGVPLPKTIRLENDGYKCPKIMRRGSSMYSCCVRDKKHKVKPTKTKFLPRQYGDLSLTYDVLQAYAGSYQAQVTIDNNHLLGRLDHWNLTWEWMRGEFIHSMRGAYTHRRDPSECIYGPAGQYYKDFDFSQVMNCDKKPVISDLPADRANDSKVGKLPYCCRNGTLLPVVMDPWKARSIFQLTVYKIPPDMNRTALSPPQRWKINGVLNPTYKCGAPIRIENTQFPDPSGLQSVTTAIASWQVTCNMTQPKPKEAKCCVSFSAYYNDSVIPCNTCACGCEDTDRKCSANARPMLLPPEAALVPFDNRTVKAKAWAKLKHNPIPATLPCPDNCGVSINWHIDTNYRGGWTARVTLFNWDEIPFEDWYTAVQLNKAFQGFDTVYSFNATKLVHRSANNTIFFQGLKGLNYLMGETNGTNPSKDPRVPGKQQSVISFKKKDNWDIDITKGDGFPTKVFFNGAECSIPTGIPTGSSDKRARVDSMLVILVGIATFALMTDRFHW